MPKQPAKYKIVVQGKQPLYRTDFRSAVQAGTAAGQRYGRSSVTIYTWDPAKQQYVVR